MPFLPDLQSYLLTATTQYLIPSTLLIATPKNSPYRYLSLPCMIYLASRFVYAVVGTTPTRCNAVAMLIVAVVQATNLMLLKPMDDDDLSRENPRRALFLSDRFWSAFEALSQTRAVNTPRQVRNVPPQPGYYSRDTGVIPRGKFLRRQAVVFVWQYLACDVFQALARRKGLEQDLQIGFEHIDWFVPLDQWIERGITNLVTWFVVNRLLIDAHYRLASILFVGLGLDIPSNWPPAFGRMADVYTIRKFWGKFWHQFLRQPFTSVSNFVARDILHLPRPSILERYTNIFIVFLLSALLHTIIDSLHAIPLEYSGSRAFFLSMVLGIMVEDGVQALWKRVQPASDAKESDAEGDAPPFWIRAVGFLWVMVWLGVTSTWYFHPMSHLPQEETFLVPFSLVERVGIEPLGAVLLVCGIGLYVGFGVEI